jgi:hypothetical protein
MAGVQQTRFSLGLIGLMEVPRRIDGCFAGHIVDQRKERAVAKMHFGFFRLLVRTFSIDLACGAGLRY